MIDFHCHLDLCRDPFAVAKACIENKIYVLSVTTTPSAWSGTKKLENGSPYILTALGIHPQLAHERHVELGLFDELLPQANFVGEVGIDGSPEFSFSLQTQQRVFRHVLNSCERNGGRVISIHCRNSSSAVLDLIQKHPNCGQPVLHWFSGSLNELNRAIEMGCWFSVNPAMTSTKRGKDIVERLPRTKTLTETDSPFLELKGRKTSPLDVGVALAGLSSIWKIRKDELSLMLFDNFRALTNRGEPG